MTTDHLGGPDIAGQNATAEALEMEAVCLDECFGLARARALAAVYFALASDGAHGLPPYELRSIGARDLGLVIDALQQCAAGYGFRGARQAEMEREFGDVARKFRFSPR